VEGHGTAWKLMERYGKFWKSMVSSLHNPVGTMEHHGNPWKPMEAHITLWNIP